MTLKNWLILFVVATVVYSVMVLVFPRIVQTQLNDDSSKVEPQVIESTGREPEANRESDNQF